MNTPIMNSSIMNSSITASELRAVVLVDVLAEEVRLKVAEDVHRAALAELAVQGVELQAAHDAVAAIARAEYAAAPPAPELPDGQPHHDALHELMRARQSLVSRQVEVMGRALPTVVQAWDLARPQLDIQARELAGEAAELAEQYASWWRLVREARKSFEQPNLVRGRILHGVSTRMRPRPGPHDVLDAASGVDLCGFGPSDGDVRAMLVSGQLDDGSGRVVVDRMSGNGRF